MGGPVSQGLERPQDFGFALADYAREQGELNSGTERTRRRVPIFASPKERVLLTRRAAETLLEQLGEAAVEDSADDDAELPHGECIEARHQLPEGLLTPESTRSSFDFTLASAGRSALL